MKTFLFLLLIPFGLFSQVLYSNGGTIHVNNGGVLYCNGGMEITNSSQVENNGLITTTINSTLAQPGNFEISSNSVVSGDGKYKIEQNWVNNATFLADKSEVILYGNKQQFITSTNNTNTAFNNLTLAGNGTALNRRKTLKNVDASTGINGVLDLKDRELNTQDRLFIVNNTDPGAILYANSYADEGFVSSLPGGFLIRKMNQAVSYLFPVGSSNNTRRFRPVVIQPSKASSQEYAVRLNNFISNNQGYPVSQHENGISEVNPAFYHSIRRIKGNANAELTIYYDPSVDKNWVSFGHWNTSNQKWRNIEHTKNKADGNYKYILKPNWNFPSDNDEYALTKDAYRISIPNVFTPNGDGANDGFYITSSGLDDYHIIILNRWGNLVYESNDPNKIWDGTSLSNRDCSQGTYFYKISAKYKGEEINENGFISLFRK